MSAPENSNSKTPPSLLSDVKQQAGGAQPARILANLEGRVTPPAEAPRRSKAPLAAVIALVAVAAGGWGVWQWQQQADEHPAAVAAASAQPAAKAGAVSGGAVQVAQNAASAASAPQPATIVNDESAAKAAGASGADENRLSRALASGAVDEPGSAPAAAAPAAAAPAAAAPAAVAKAETAKGGTKLAARGKAETKADAARAKADAARKHRTQQLELAQAKKRHDASARQPGAKDDPDADLLEALVARTRPADAKSRAVPVSAKAAGTTLAARVKDCGTRGFFEDQLCRWRVCDGHWGTDPACPATQQHSPQQQ
ncbi:phage tail protein [Burkholderia guangdongensis]|uniref:phage tail protein n=1 Tax=Burkholderia guangdongensis TaxID=1792500 RepID=UPI0015CC859E|nr:phage tail protein [Burkholderia guangdongensis]